MDDNFTIPSNILNDLCSRFIINVPEEERNDLIRIFFQIEIAHWFYLDFFCNEDPKLKPCSIRTFAENIFRHCSFLIQHSNRVDDILSKWKVFKNAVPTNGAIILDETMKYVLLVQGFWAKASWGFPKGKVIEEETEMRCAIREVLEETGYDISQKCLPEQYLQIQINDQVIRLYIITNVPKDTKFEPQTRREIKEVRWFAIDELPVNRKDTRSKQILGYAPNAFFMVIPFVKSLKQWIAAQQTPNNGGKHHSHLHSHHHGHHTHGHHHHHSNHQQQQPNYKSLVYNSSNYDENQISASTSTPQSLSSSISYPSLQSTTSANFVSNQHVNSSNIQNKRSPSTNFKETAVKEELKRKQVQYYNKINKEEFDDLMSIRSSSNKYQNNKLGGSTSTGSSLTASSTTTNSQLGVHSNSRFKPVNKTKTIIAANSSNTPGILNISTTTNQQSTAANSTTTTRNTLHRQQTYIVKDSTNNHLAFNSKAKKQLDFYGPECWINFKFNYDSLLSDLPTPYM